MANRTITVKVVLDDADVGRFERNLEQAVRGADGFGGANSKLAAFGATVGQVGALVGTALVGALALAATKAVKLAGDLQQSVANISSIKPEIDTRQVFQALNEMSTRIPQSAEQLGDALYDVFSSVNVTQAEGLKLVEQFARGATAAATDAKTFGTSVVGVMNAYKLSVDDAAHVQDVFFNTVKNGVVTGEELAQSLGPVAQSAKAAGLSVNELGGFIAGVTKEGGPAAQNINNLNNFLLKIITPSKEAAGQFAAMGITLKDSATGGVRPMIEVLEEMRGKMSQMSEFERNQTLAKMFPDAQALTGARVLLSQLDEIKKYTDENAKSSGSAREAYEKMVNTWNSQSTLLQNTALAILRQLGAEILPLITPLIKALAENLPSAIEYTKRAIAVLKQAWNEDFGSIRTTAVQAVEYIVKWWRENLPLIKQTVETVLSAIKAFWTNYGRDIFAIVRDNWDLIKSTIKLALDVILGAVKLAMQVITGDWRGAFNTLLDIAKSIATGITNAMVAMVQRVVDQFKLMASLSIGAMRSAVSTFVGIGRDIVNGIINGVRERASAFADTVKNMANSAIATAKNALGIRSPSTEFFQIGVFIMQGLENGVESRADEVAAAIGGAAQLGINQALSTLEISGGKSGVFEGIGASATASFEGGVRAGTPGVHSAFDGLFRGVQDLIGQGLDWITSKLGAFGGLVNNILKGLLGALGNYLSQSTNAIARFAGTILGGGSGASGGGLGGILGGGGSGAGGLGAGLGSAGFLGAVGLGGALGGAVGGNSGASGIIGNIGGALAGAGVFGALAGFGGTAAAVGGITGSVGLGATAGALLSNPITAIAGGALLVGAYFLNRAKQRRSDEEKSGEALQAAVDLIKTTAEGINRDEFKFANQGEADAFLNDSILKPFKDYINTLKTKSVRDSRLTNQVRDLENLYNSLVGDAIKRQQERLAAAATANTTTTTTGGGTTGTSDPFNFASAPTSVTIETLNVSFLAGSEDASKVVVAGAKTKDGADVIVKTVKIAAANGEL